MMRFLKVVLLLNGALAGMAQDGPLAERTPITIVLVGDSTVAPEGGWGPGFCAAMTPNVTCVNQALNGRSTKSFIDEGAWRKALDRRGRYYFIQFGHNDQKPDPARHADAATAYQDNLHRFVREVRAIGAVPILVSSLSRRNYRGGALISDDGLRDYAEAARQVAAQDGVAFVDLYALSTALLGGMTQEQADAFNMAGHGDAKAENATAVRPDRTHLNPKGQALFGRMVADAAGRVQPELAPNIVAEPRAPVQAAPADDPEPQWAVLNRAARQAVQNKDYAKLRAILEQLRPLMPGNARVLYNLAAAEAALGNTGKALAGLGELAAAGVYYDLAADGDFASLRQAPEYAAAVRRMEENRRPVTHSELVRQLERPDLLPEDLAWDGKSSTLLVSSVTGSEVLRVGGKTLARTPWSAMALRIDPARDLLWTTSAWLPHCASCRAGDKDKTALVAFHLATGAPAGEYPSPVPGMFGDMTMARNGDLFVSEGIHGAVFRFSQGRYERLDPPGEFRSPQTPALSRDERTLYVPDYLRGIAALDLQTRRVRWLQPGPGIVLNGIDGLYVDRDCFIAVQNGTTPARIVRFSLDLKKQQILESGYPELGEPTHGVLAGGKFYFLANTGWNEFGEDGRKKPGSQPVVSSIRRIDLSRLRRP